MMVFLMLPAITWEKMGPFSAVKKGLVVFRTNLSGFAKAYALSYVAAIFIFALPAAVFLITGKLEIEIPTWLWVVLIVYIGFGTSYVIYLEQLFAAELYLWHMRWERAVSDSLGANKPLPDIAHISRPTVLDEIREFRDSRKSSRTYRR
jgi:hypothetical protein